MGEEDWERRHSDGRIDRLMDLLTALREGQDDSAEKLERIYKALYDPDAGLYARIRNNEAGIDELKSFKSNMNKLTWFLTSTTVGLALKFFFDSFTI